MGGGRLLIEQAVIDAGRWGRQQGASLQRAIPATKVQTHAHAHARICAASCDDTCYRTSAHQHASHAHAMSLFLDVQR